MSKLTRQQFIEKLAPYAMADMRVNNIAASLTIAQGILESADGNSSLAVKANNLFGIKGTGTAGSVEMITTEYVKGVAHRVTAKFRKYNSWKESVADHSLLFINGVSWNRQLYHDVIGKDGIAAARAVHKAGYATDPDYSDKLIALIHQNNLLEYDRLQTDIDPNADLESRIEALLARIDDLQDRLDVQTEEIPAPEWLLQEFPNALDLLNQKTGTRSFWRSYAITLRAIKDSNIFFS